MTHKCEFIVFFCYSFYFYYHTGLFISHLDTCQRKKSMNVYIVQLEVYSILSSVLFLFFRLDNKLHPSLRFYIPTHTCVGQRSLSVILYVYSNVYEQTGERESKFFNTISMRSGAHD